VKNFETLKANIQAILVAYADGRFRVVGHAGQSRSASEVKDYSRSVQVYFSLGRFDRDRNPSNIGPYEHDVTFKLELTVSAATKVNLLVLNDANATEGQVSTALADFQEASYLADQSIDELYGIVWDILMDARNYDLGFPKGYVTNRWIPQFTKDDPLNRGWLVTLTGAAELNVRVIEDSPGDTPEECSVIDVTVDVDGDDVERAGVKVEYD
jgi:hypothetical protein